jgi:hypothetical protein
MSGTLVTTHQLIQVGIALDEDEVFSSRIGWEEFEYEPEALAAIGLKPEDVRCGPPVAQVDEAAADWLSARNVEPGKLIAIGWGVTAFDLPFVITSLPRVTALLNHHSIELNAICHTLGGSKPYVGERPSAATWKQMAKHVAEAHLLLSKGLEPRWHDAGYDALASLIAWRWLRQVTADPLPGLIPASPPHDGQAPSPISIR